MNRRIVAVVSIALTVLIAALMVWSLFRYDTTVLALTYEANPIMSSPLSDVEYSWEAKSYGTRNFGSSPLEGEGYIHRERVTSENRFRYAEFHNVNVALRLRLQIANGTDHTICNVTLDITDGCNRQIMLEFRPGTAEVGNKLEMRIVLNLSVNYNYGSVDGEQKQFSLQREWMEMVQVQQSEPKSGTTFT